MRTKLTLYLSSQKNMRVQDQNVFTCTHTYVIPLSTICRWFNFSSQAKIFAVKIWRLFFSQGCVFLNLLHDRGPSWSVRERVKSLPEMGRKNRTNPLICIGIHGKSASKPIFVQGPCKNTDWRMKTRYFLMLIPPYPPPTPTPAMFPRKYALGDALFKCQENN